jgi:PAS domain S-box-containing protein
MAARVLMIEGDAGRLEAVGRRLRAEGFHVVDARTAAAGLDVARDLPDLVIVDLDLPDESGLEVCRAIKDDPATHALPVVAASARLAGAQGLDRGADAYLAHPVDANVALATIRSLLRLRDAERARTELEAQMLSVERRHRVVTDAATVGLVQVDAQGRVRFMNPAAEAITGHAFAEAEGKALHDVVDGVAIEGEAIRDLRREIRRRDGTSLAVVLSATPIVDRGQRLGAVVEIKDDGERVRSERTRELFLGALGHDLRGPLHAMLIGCDALLDMEGRGSEERAVLETMRRSIQRMNRLIENMLLFAQTIVEGMPVDRRPADLVRIVNSVIGETALRNPGRAIALRGPAQLRGAWDPDRLTQVVDNLVANALRHGEGAIDLALAEEDNDAVLTVHNRGTPIPVEALPFLFDAFRRGGARRSGGVGLGLYIVATIVHAHQGTIEVTSTAEAGTAFRVRLPRRP